MPAITRQNLERHLHDLEFPADRDEIVEHVLAKEPHDSVARTLEGLPQRKYASPAEVGHTLDPVQPLTWKAPSRDPKPESG